MPTSLVFPTFRKYWLSKQFKHLLYMLKKNYLSFNAILLDLFCILNFGMAGKGKKIKKKLF